MPKLAVQLRNNVTLKILAIANKQLKEVRASLSDRTNEMDDLDGVLEIVVPSRVASVEPYQLRDIFAQ